MRQIVEAFQTNGWYREAKSMLFTGRNVRDDAIIEIVATVHSSAFAAIGAIQKYLILNVCFKKSWPSPWN